MRTQPFFVILCPCFLFACKQFVLHSNILMRKKNTHFDVLLNVSNDFRKYDLADVHVLLCSQHNNFQFCDCCQADKICLDQKRIFIYFMASTEVSCHHKVPLFFVYPVFIFFLYHNTFSSSKTTFYSSIVCIGLHSGVFVI